MQACSSPKCENPQELNHFRRAMAKRRNQFKKAKIVEIADQRKSKRLKHDGVAAPEGAPQSQDAGRDSPEFMLDGNACSPVLLRSPQSKLRDQPSRVHRFWMCPEDPTKAMCYLTEDAYQSLASFADAYVQLIWSFHTRIVGPKGQDLPGGVLVQPLLVLGEDAKAFILRLLQLGQPIQFAKDFASLLITFHYGGWFFDLDVIWTRNLFPQFSNQPHIFYLEPTLAIRKSQRTIQTEEGSWASLWLGAFYIPHGSALALSAANLMKEHWTTELSAYESGRKVRPNNNSKRTDWGFNSNLLWSRIQSFQERFHDPEDEIKVIAPHVGVSPFPHWLVKLEQLGTNCRGYKIPTMAQVAADCIAVTFWGRQWTTVFKASLLSLLESHTQQKEVAKVTSRRAAFLAFFEAVLPWVEVSLGSKADAYTIMGHCVGNLEQNWFARYLLCQHEVSMLGYALLTFMVCRANGCHLEEPCIQRLLARGSTTSRKSVCHVVSDMVRFYELEAPPEAPASGNPAPPSPG